MGGGKGGWVRGGRRGGYMVERLETFDIHYKDGDRALSMSTRHNLQE